MIRPLERLDVASFRGVLELVLDELRERIVSGELRPGEPLRQRDLAEELGVSREPIKQAMRVLEAEGLVVSPPRRSATVAPITSKTIEDVYEVRAALEAIVARRAAGLAEPQRTRLCDDLDGLIREAGRPEVGRARRLVELDSTFHLRIYEAAGNDVATAIFRARWIHIGRAMSLVASTQYFQRAWREHRRIREAIRAGDADEASTLAHGHAVDAAAWLVANAPEITSDDDELSAPER